MNIAICDDEPAQAKLLAHCVLQWSRERKNTVVIKQYISADAFLFAWEDNGCDLLLLDIQMPGTSGMELARFIRKRDEHIAIVFVTGYADYISEGYDVAAMHYLMKPVKNDKLFAVLDRAVRAAVPEHLLLECADGPVRVEPGEILSVEAFAHICRVTTTRGAFEVTQSLGSLERLLERNDFVQPHRSYLVNLRHVRRAGNYALEMDDGTIIPLSRRRFHVVQQSFLTLYRGDI